MSFWELNLECQTWKQALLETQQYLWINLEILKISLDFSSLVKIQV